jgi:hypothetical protein
MGRQVNTYLMLFIGIVFIICAQTAMMVYLGERGIGVPEGTRQVVCIGVLGNTLNPARDDPRIVASCAEVGINIEDYPPTDTTPEETP